MRIASGRPRAAALPLGQTLFYAITAACVVVFGVIIARRFAAQADHSGALSSRLSTADAFGLGGLSHLRMDGTGKAASSPIEHNRVVTYYGTPRTPSMGILGQHAPEDAADMLAQRAARFEEVDPALRVLPALHLVYAVAQPQSEKDALYLSYVDDRTVRQFIDLARRRGFALILDLQIGHSNALAEVRKIEKYLEEPDVFVALDPEFALHGSLKPGEAIGAIDAGDVNAVQWYLGKLSANLHLPKKMLIVHQFQAEMITAAASIEHHDDVDLVIDVDGYGPADIKQAKYIRYGAAPYAPFGGIKVFLQQDPDPLTEGQLLSLSPKPSLFVYQ
ncbi:MAG: hypothetical protein M3P30_14585 [Chloroflexota bacterium]|nr:hypothetical protein [Chloroflexota bacterium]